MSEAIIQSAVTALQSDGGRSIVVLSGAPGTGKSFHSLRIAQRFSQNPLFVAQVQFHNAYAYEDLIEGLRPNRVGGFDLADGSLLNWNLQALSDPTHSYVFLIEELTRANVSAVLGELLTYIEYRDRYFILPISRRRVRIAENLAILATMNPQDKSALELDDALIRRLRILTLPPSVDELADILQANLTGSAEEAKAIRDGLTGMFEACRREFPDTFEDMMPFGHGVFSGIKTAADLHALWRQNLRFLLQRTPHVPPHAFAEVIKSHFLWKD